MVLQGDARWGWVIQSRHTLHPMSLCEMMSSARHSQAAQSAPVQNLMLSSGLEWAALQMYRSILAESVGMSASTNFTEGLVATMDWGKAYLREQRATWADIAESIRYSVSMAEVLRVYSPETPIRGKRCPCPLHNGKDYNMSFTATNFHCFVCGESGDVIEFVTKILNLPSRADAMKRMNGDLKLGLPIGELVNAEQAGKKRWQGSGSGRCGTIGTTP